MMTTETVAARRRAGIAFGAGLISLWLSVFPWGAIGLLLRLAGFVGVGLSMRWAFDADHPIRRKVAGISLVLAFALQGRNFFHSASLAEDSPYGAFVQFYLADHLVPVILLFATAVFPRAGRRRTETALLWTATGISAALVFVGLANGMLMQTRGDPTPAEYRYLVAMMRTVSYGPALAAAVMLLVPAREVVTEAEAWAVARQAQAEAAVALKEAAAAMEDLTSTSSDGTHEVVQELTPAAQLTPNSSEEDLMALLDARLAKGDLTEESWKLLRAKYERIGPSKSGRKPPI
jgi:uncharacterized membrane protein